MDVGAAFAIHPLQVLEIPTARQAGPCLSILRLSAVVTHARVPIGANLAPPILALEIWSRDEEMCYHLFEQPTVARWRCRATSQFSSSHTYHWLVPNCRLTFPSLSCTGTLGKRVWCPMQRKFKFTGNKADLKESQYYPTQFGICWVPAWGQT